MTLSIKLVFAILAVVCFALKLLGVPTGRFDLMAGGFLFAFCFLAF